eukprot:2790348-Rhodomonas_salina.1
MFANLNKIKDPSTGKYRIRTKVPRSSPPPAPPTPAPPYHTNPRVCAAAPCLHTHAPCSLAHTRLHTRSMLTPESFSSLPLPSSLSLARLLARSLALSLSLGLSLPRLPRPLQGLGGG